jgi:hypothetical protein
MIGARSLSYHGAAAMVVATGRKAPHLLKNHHTVEPQADYNYSGNGGPKGFQGQVAFDG